MLLLFSFGSCSLLCNGGAGFIWRAKLWGLEFEGHAHAGGQSEGEAADVYQQHRHEALRLSRQWQKLMRRAGTAYAAEHHSGQLPVMCCTS